LSQTADGHRTGDIPRESQPRRAADGSRVTRPGVLRHATSGQPDRVPLPLYKSVQRYHRSLQRAFYTSALISIRTCVESRRFYERKRAEGKRHTQAVLALARRRGNVLWALIWP
jgi:hypothetical protein